MARTVAIGAQDFCKIRKNNSFYIDKTGFIKEWWENSDEVTLITRPRRFGKTLTMDMVNCFFSIQFKDGGGLFEGLSIWDEEKYRGLQGTYPVLFLSFANVKAGNFETAEKKLCQILVNLFQDFDFLVTSGFLQGEDRAFFDRVSIGMDRADLENTLGQMCRYLCKYYGRKVILLLDEYDTPMQEAYVNGFWDELVDLMRGLFHAAFKTNPYLERAVLTGITRVSKESVFSDLNNLEVVTTASEKYGSAFGFTREEVEQALKEFGMPEKAGEVRQWYDGFRFGNCKGIYNPWSITQFLDKKKVGAYWANTSSNAWIAKLLQESDREIKKNLEDLLNGGSICVELDEQIVFHELDTNRDAIWSLLLASGYLKIVNLESNKETELPEYELALTNRETVFLLRKMIHGWFASCKSNYNDFIKALLQNDLDGMTEYLNRITLSVISNFDSGNRPSEKAEPEKFYHGLVLGLMLDLRDDYVITSNRESGFGRYDLLFAPRGPGKDGMIFEFKVFRPGKEKTLEDTAHAAICQIVEKKYAAALKGQGLRTERIRVYGFAFRGKEVFIDGGYLAEVADIAGK